MEWKVTRIDPSPNPVECAGRELEMAGGLARRLEPMRLAAELDRVPLWRERPHIRIEELAYEFCRHLHLPRLHNWGVLAKVIVECLTTTGWESFGYALRYDDAKGYDLLYFRGMGLKPTTGLLENRVGLLVKPDVARAQLECGSRPLPGG